jgi:hypothetical protein
MVSLIPSFITYHIICVFTMELLTGVNEILVLGSEVPSTILCIVNGYGQGISDMIIHKGPPRLNPR